MLRDSLAILSLVLGTAVLFAITLFLFRSFNAHRADLAQRWSGRGRIALQAGKPDQAIVALRTALTYAPGNRAYELLLAQALGQTGRPDESEESYQYFMTLWDVEPGNGLINLQLARLAAQHNDPQSRRDAVNFYRAAIYGTWEGDGVVRRAGVRLELARYFMAQRDLASARMELLIAGGNAPDDYDRDMAIGALLQQAGDPAEAWVYYQRAIAARRDDTAALEAAGHLAYEAGDYLDARSMFTRAHAEDLAKDSPAAQTAADAAMMGKAARTLELLPSSTLSPRERVAHLLAARAIAKKRFDACTAVPAATTNLPAALQALSTRWGGPNGTANASSLLRDPDQQASAMQLIYDTEKQGETLCGTPTGDDALLFKLATSPQMTFPPVADTVTQPPIPHD